MKIINNMLAVSLISALCIPTGAQAFCFLKGNNNDSRSYGAYNYLPPAVGFTPVYAYPYSAARVGGLNAGYYPAYPAGLPGAGPYSGMRVWQ